MLIKLSDLWGCGCTLPTLPKRPTSRQADCRRRCISATRLEFCNNWYKCKWSTQPSKNANKPMKPLKPKTAPYTALPANTSRQHSDWADHSRSQPEPQESDPKRRYHEQQHWRIQAKPDSFWNKLFSLCGFILYPTQVMDVGAKLFSISTPVPRSQAKIAWTRKVKAW